MNKKKDLRALVAGKFIPVIAGMLTLAGCGARQTDGKQSAPDPLVDTMRVVDKCDYTYGHGSTDVWLHGINTSGNYVVYLVTGSNAAKYAVHVQDTIVIKKYDSNRDFVKVTENLSNNTRIRREMQR